MFNNKLLNDLQRRGFVQAMTGQDDLHEALESTCVVYCGFDCTADSLHVGSLIPLKMLKFFKDAGHIVVPVIGTATTKIGDPSGKDSARPLLTESEIDKNAEGIEKSIKSVLGDVKCLRNEKFFDSMNVFDFMRIIGKHISINSMLRLTSVEERLEKEEGMSFLEFSYSLFQAHDFERIINLHRNNHVIQIGGSDQWGNITMGLELAKKAWIWDHPMKEPFGITTPLLLDANGNKVGKTVDGAVWLNQNKLMHFDFWQFWRNIDDKDVGRFMKLFSDSSVEFIDAHLKVMGTFADVGAVNETKKALATEITAIVRGQDAANGAMWTAESAFEKKDDTMLPERTIDPAFIGQSLAKFLRENGFMSSVGEARRTMCRRPRTRKLIIISEGFP